MIRVSGGIYGKMKLISPDTKNSRPTDSKVKEAVLNMLYPLNQESRILDLFSCTGQIGIEFLSMGSKEVVFNEINRRNYSNLLSNLEKIKAKSYATYNNDFRKTLKILNNNKMKFDYIYLDPPYNTDYVFLSLKLIVKYALLNYKGKIITEMDRNIDFSKDISELSLIKSKTYGRKIIKIYQLK